MYVFVLCPVHFFGPFNVFYFEIDTELSGSNEHLNWLSNDNDHITV